MFTYQITEAEFGFLKPGIRVAVPFGKSKIYTGLVFKKHRNKPTAYESKEIHQILDEFPIITDPQLRLWQWISEYYMCSLGEVMRASVPSLFLLESETIVFLDKIDEGNLCTEDESKIIEALKYQEVLKVGEIAALLEIKNALPVLQNLIKQGIVGVKEEIYEQYKPKLEKYVKLSEIYQNNGDLEKLLEQLNRAPKQKEVLLTYFKLIVQKEKLKLKDLLQESNANSGVIKSLEEKGIFEIYQKQIDRVSFEAETEKISKLNEAQEEAFTQINQSFKSKDVVLLHGVTSSGKTEIYSRLIETCLKEGKQVLFLLPEIALTTQIILRLQKYFGSSVAVFHSKYSTQERVEIWNNLLNHPTKAQIILGARSSVLLPFKKLGLIIVDEEHESSYKQFDPAPRYHARDAAVVLASIHKAKVVLGSATPSVESYFNTKHDKYGLVELNQRYLNLQLPEIELTDIKEKHKRKLMNGHFSDRLIDLMQEVLENKEQIILFQNRRGYSPIVECNSCGNSPHCPNCDVSLTYHKYKEELRCHYCGFHQNIPEACPACGNADLDARGFGTEQIELEIKEIFPQARVSRMDLDTTRSKYGYHNIISAFEDREIDILVGTQMLSKGLDFDHVRLVGILNADNMLNFPDFRAHERSYQLMVQVSGRAGRSSRRGKVIIQTFNPYHQILQQVSLHDYVGMYKDQLNERHQFLYPPLVRMVKIHLKHRNLHLLEKGSEWLAKSLTNSFGDLVLGPTEPSIPRVRNQYIKNILIKLPKNISLQESKSVIQKIKISFESISEFRPIRLNIDVDPQ